MVLDADIMKCAQSKQTIWQPNHFGFPEEIVQQVILLPDADKSEAEIESNEGNKDSEDFEPPVEDDDPKPTTISKKI